MSQEKIKGAGNDVSEEDIDLETEGGNDSNESNESNRDNNVSDSNNESNNGSNDEGDETEEDMKLNAREKKLQRSFNHNLSKIKQSDDLLTALVTEAIIDNNEEMDECIVDSLMRLLHIVKVSPKELVEVLKLRGVKSKTIVLYFEKGLKKYNPNYVCKGGNSGNPNPRNFNATDKLGYRIRSGQLNVLAVQQLHQSVTGGTSIRSTLRGINNHGGIKGSDITSAINTPEYIQRSLAAVEARRRAFQNSTRPVLSLGGLGRGGVRPDGTTAATYNLVHGDQESKNEENNNGQAVLTPSPLNEEKLMDIIDRNEDELNEFLRDEVKEDNGRNRDATPAPTNNGNVNGGNGNTVIGGAGGVGGAVNGGNVNQQQDLPTRNVSSLRELEPDSDNDDQVDID